MRMTDSRDAVSGGASSPKLVPSASLSTAGAPHLSEADVLEEMASGVAADAQVERSGEEAGSRRGFAGAAGMIAGLTMLARLVGFGRIFVFSWAVGLTTLGNVYQTINTLPNIIFEIVAGGALAAVVVPLLSGAITRGDHHHVRQTSSALLTWTISVLTPLAVLAAVAAQPVVRALLGSSASPDEVALGSRMLVVFAPQLVLYGVGVVLAGILQAHHRFAGPALAPLLSSLTVMAAYLLFALVAGRGAEVAGLSRGHELILSVGTTLGVVALSLCLLVPLRGTGVRLRPTYRFPVGVARRAGALIASGVLAVAGQQLALLAVLVLSQRPAPIGSMVAYNLAQTIYLVPWAVLAVPVATSVFPRLSASFDNGDRATFHQTLRGALTAVIVLSTMAAALLIAGSGPIATVITTVAKGNDNPDWIATAVAAFAFGLLGYSLLALLTRALYAAGATWSTALVTVSGWLVVIAADIVLSQLLPVDQRVAAVAAGNSIGMTVVGVGLMWWARRVLGSEILQGITRTLCATLIALAVSAAAGWWIAYAWDPRSLSAALAAGAVVAGCVVAVFTALVMVADRAAMRPVLARVRAIARRARG